jgi:hypothetical protein
METLRSLSLQAEMTSVRETFLELQGRAIKYSSEEVARPSIRFKAGASKSSEKRNCLTTKQAPIRSPALQLPPSSGEHSCDTYSMFVTRRSFTQCYCTSNHHHPSLSTGNAALLAIPVPCVAAPPLPRR